MNGTSIGFGGGEVIEVNMPIGEVRALLEIALMRRHFIEFKVEPNNETMILNPFQVKILQKS